MESTGRLTTPTCVFSKPSTRMVFTSPSSIRSTSIYCVLGDCGVNLSFNKQSRFLDPSDLRARTIKKTDVATAAKRDTCRALCTRLTKNLWVGASPLASISIFRRASI